MSSGIPEHYSLTDYHNFRVVDHVIKVLLLDLLQKYRGYWCVLPDQKNQIKIKLNHMPWKPTTQLYLEIDFAGVPISREEVIEKTCLYKEEHKHPYSIAVVYWWIDTPQIDQI